MIPLTLAEVAEAVGGTVAPEDAGVEVTAVSTDSREATLGALFVALRGEHADGHDFVGDAVDGGAAGYLARQPVAGRRGAVVVSDTWEALRRLAAAVRDGVDPLVVAVTGSVGKTTTKDLIAAAVGAGRDTIAASGSFNNELGVPLTLLSLRAGTEVLVVEIGARGRGHIAALTPIVRPDVSVVTAVAAAHLELFGDLDAVVAAKGELVEALAPGGTAVLNADDDLVLGMAARTGASVVTYGRRAEAPVRGRTVPVDVVARDVRLDRLARPSFAATTPWGDAELRLGLAGAHHVSGALAALAVAGLASVDVRQAAAALERAPVAPWRSEVHEAGGVVVLNDAYNANPASVAAGLAALSGIQLPNGGRRWAVLGIMAELGEEADLEHARVGDTAVGLGIDRIVVVGDGARAILEGARRAGAGEGSVRLVADADGASDLLRAEVRAGDAVLVKASRVAGLERAAVRLLDWLADA